MVILAIILGYLLGSIPASYILGRLLKGIDIRQYGSRSVSGSNVWVHVARWGVVVVGLFDIAKAALPTWLALQWGLGLPGAAMAGLAAMAGHNWSIYLGFTGGRGLGTSLGVLLVLAPWGTVLVLGSLGLGALLRNVPLAAGVGMALLPIVAWGLGEPPAVILACLMMALLTFAKRLLANRGQVSVLRAGREVLINRLLFDRDIRDREAWIYRAPLGQGQPPEEVETIEEE
ncbi:MAG: glycerol-3-phosphate acyltransferase [Anaerolineae bacterium]